MKRMAEGIIAEIIAEEGPEAAERRARERQALLDACGEWQEMMDCC
jgi:hypothetical protein